MENSYDTHLFIEIILSEGARHLYCSDNHDLGIEYYTGRSGNEKVQICIADEVISITACKMYLIQLGMSDLIHPLFGNK